MTRAAMTRLAAGVCAATLGAGALTLASGQPAAADQTYWVPVTGSLTIDGHGFGHGHGMSQYGAQGAALDQVKYRDILAFYYPKTTLGEVKGRIRVLLSVDTTSDVKVSPAKGLSVRDLGTHRTFTLPTHSAIDRWRLVPNSDNDTAVQLHRGGAWTRYRILHGDGEFFADRPIKLWVPSGDAEVAKTYRGRLRSASPYSGATFRDTVNVLSLDDYVQGVIPPEMPPSWKPAALRAQAVAARTFAAYERALSRDRYYQICDNTFCQVYAGKSVEAESTNKAVDATAHEILRYAKKPALTQFSSSSGGWTSDGGLPYLPAQRDPYDDWSGNLVHSWQANISVSRLESLLPQLGKLKAVRVTQRDGDGAWGGRIIQMVLVGRDSSIPMSGDDFRSTFGLRSSWFRIEPTPIIARWNRIGGPESVLGKVKSAEFGVGKDGAAQLFAHGRIYWSPRTPARELYGDILARYRKLGGPDSVLGYPVSNTRRAHDGGHRTVFQRGKIFWSKPFGAREVYGKILAKYEALGQAAGQLGYPATGVFSVKAGKRVKFQHGSLTYVRATGKVVVNLH
jgi:stage II sporulation protein D